MGTGWIHHYRKLLSGRVYVLNWELQKASQLAKRNKKIHYKSNINSGEDRTLYCQREAHKEEQAWSKLDSYALPLASDYCLVFAAPRKECWRKQDSFHLRVCGTSSVEACQKAWLSKQFSSVTTTELLNVATATIPSHSTEQQLPLYMPSGQLYKLEEHKLHFMKAGKGCFSGSASAGGVFRTYGKKERSDIHATSSLSHIRSKSLEQCGHCTSPPFPLQHKSLAQPQVQQNARLKHAMVCASAPQEAQQH